MFAYVNPCYFDWLSRSSDSSRRNPIPILMLLLSCLLWHADLQAQSPELQRLEAIRTAAANAPAATEQQLTKIVSDLVENRRFYEAAFQQIALVESVRNQGKDLAAYQLIDTGIKYARVSEARTAEAALRLLLVDYYWLRGDQKSADRELAKAAELAELVNVPELTIEVLVKRAEFAAEQAGLEAALDQLNLIEQNFHTQIPRIAATYHATRAAILRRAGDLEAALDEAQAAVDLAAQAGTWHQVLQYFNLALVEEYIGSTKQAREHYLKSRSLAQSIGEIVGIAFADQALGDLAFYTGDYQQARERYLAALPAFAQNRITPMEAWMALGIAETYIYQNQPEAAAPYLNQAETLINGLEDLSLRSTLAYVQAQFASSNGNHELALSFYQAYVQLDRERQDQAAQTNMRKLVEDLQQREQLAISQRDQALQQLQQRRQQVQQLQWQYLAVLSVILVLLLALHSWRWWQSRKLQHELAYIRSHDVLSEAPNRQHINSIAQQAITRALVNKHGLSIGIIEIDHLKMINSQLGHDFGDLLIQQFSLLMQRKLQPTHCFGRVNGAQWLIIFAQFETADAHTWHADFNAAFQQISVQSSLSEASNATPPLSCSMGFARLDLDGESFKAFFKRAEDALHQGNPGQFTAAAMPPPLQS